MAAEDWIDWNDEFDEEFDRPTKLLYPNSETEWNYNFIKHMDISHCFNTAKLILNKSKELYFIERQTAKVKLDKGSIFYANGLKPVSWDNYLEWFEQRFPCFDALVKRIGPELEALLPGVEWEDQ